MFQLVLYVVVVLFVAALGMAVLLGCYSKEDEFGNK